MKTPIERFNDRMQDLFYRTPGAWTSNMPRIDANGFIANYGVICVDPKQAASAVLFLAKHFNVRPDLEHAEAYGGANIRIHFALNPKDAFKAQQASIEAKHAEDWNALKATTETVNA